MLARLGQTCTQGVVFWAELQQDLVCPESLVLKHQSLDHQIPLLFGWNSSDRRLQIRC